MPTPFTIWIVTPDGYSHTRSFEEQAIALEAAFKALGYEASIITDPKDMKGYTVVLGANLLATVRPESLPRKLIIYNMEQIQEGSEWITPEYLSLLKRYPVWDYSLRNIEKLRHLGVQKIALCGVGYMPELSRIPAMEEDIDVVFVGTMNPRRIKVLEALAARGIKVTAAFDMYGKERDTLLARGKIGLNMHFYEAQIFEITRVSYLLANHKCVVSETGHDRELEDPLREGIAFTAYDGIVDTCARLLSKPDERNSLAQKGFELYRQCSLIPMLKRAIETTFAKAG